MDTPTLFTFEVSTYTTDEDAEFELRMRCQGRIVWSAKTPVDFSAQNNDWPYEPSTPLTPADLEIALNRIGWRTLSAWTDNATDPGYLSAPITPTEWAVPQIALPASVLARLAPISGPTAES